MGTVLSPSPYHLSQCLLLLAEVLGSSLVKEPDGNWWGLRRRKVRQEAKQHELDSNVILTFLLAC